MKKALLVSYLVCIILIQAQNLRYFQQANLDYYEIQEETDTLKSDLQCSIYCTQGHCCEGSIFDGNSCKLLQNVYMSQNPSQTRAWIDSEIYSRGLVTERVLMITGDPSVDSLVAELVDLKTQTSCLANITYPIGKSFLSYILHTRCRFCAICM